MMDIYRTATAITSGPKPQSSSSTDDLITATTTADGHKELIIGPQRVLPGRLSVCRTFGDLEAKIAALGGNPQVVIPIPEIRSFRLEPDECDFIVIGSKYCKFSLNIK
jgi:Protein phosphatase 2C